MTSDADNIANLALFAQLQATATSTTNSPVFPKDVLTQLYLAAGAGLADGGARLISTAINGKSISFQVDADLTTSRLLTALRGALAFVGTYTAAQLEAVLGAVPSSVGCIRF